MQPSDSSPPESAPPSLASRTVLLFQDFRDLALDHVELAVLEAQRTGVDFIKMMIAAVVISILVVSAWLALVSSGIVWMTTLGVSWPGALALGAILNLALAGALTLWVRGRAAEPLFAATLRQLRRTADDVQAEVAP